MRQSNGQSLKALLLRLHRDDRGAEKMEILLILAAIVIPLLGLLILFRDNLSTWVQEVWNDTRGDGDYTPPTLD